MSTTVESTRDVERAPITPVMWRVAGGLALAHVVLLFAGFSQEKSLIFGASVADAKTAYVDSDMARILAGGFVESFSFILLVPVLVFLARVIGRRTEIGRWAGQTSLAAGLGYVVVTLASGMPPLGAALYSAQHGADLHTALMVTYIRNFAFVLSLMLLSLQAVALGIAAISDRRFTTWMGRGGIVMGVLLIVGVAGGGLGLHDYVSMLWFVWWIGVAVCLFRAPGQPEHT